MASVATDHRSVTSKKTSSTTGSSNAPKGLLNYVFYNSYLEYGDGNLDKFRENTFSMMTLLKIFNGEMI